MSVLFTTSYISASTHENNLVTRCTTSVRSAALTVAVLLFCLPAADVRLQAHETPAGVNASQSSGSDADGKAKDSNSTDASTDGFQSGRLRIRRHPDAVPSAECFPVETLPEDLQTLSKQLLLDAFDSEALYTLVSDIKPVSEGFYDT